MPGWLFGVALAGTAGIINAGGVIIQKRAHIANSKLPVEEQTSYVANKWWLLGFAVYVVGNLSNALALTFASQSIVTPLNSVNLVANTLMAPFFLGETLTRIDVIATLLIICGCTITVLFGSHADKGTALYLTLNRAIHFSTSFFFFFGLTCCQCFLWMP
jgi:drug/metabolite transporter (DMT)-like permease